MARALLDIGMIAIRRDEMNDELRSCSKRRMGFVES